MGRQYLRVYDLTITPSSGVSRVVRGLRVSFKITKSVISHPNICKLILYNPNDDTRAALREKGTRIVLNVGYEGNVRLLFTGEVRNVFQGRRGVDSTITLYSGDGQHDWVNATYNKTLSGSVTAKGAVDELLKTFSNTPVGHATGVPDIADKLMGQTLSGSSRELMDEYASEYGFDWSIQNGELIITPIGSPIEGREAVLVSAATGMIGSPTLTEIGVEVTTLLNTELLPNRGMQVDSVNYDANLANLHFQKTHRTVGTGIYKIQEVEFSGDSRDGDWLSSVKGRYVN